MIRVEGLTKTYGDFKALNQVSFEINRGEIVGFLGPNGAGKSTTLRILTGYISPSSGTAWLAGQNISEMNESYREHVGYLPEGAPLYPEMSVSRFLLFVAKIRQIPSSERCAAVDLVINQCGLESMRFRTMSTLSKGYRQRVGIAQAIIHQPDVLILDEPTSGLDPNQLDEILSLIREYGAGRTVLFSSHILSEVQAVCTRVLILNQGQLIADDTPEHLAKKLSGHRYCLTIQGADTTAALSELRTAPGVIGVSVSQVEVDSISLHLELESDIHRGEISKRVIGAGWSLIEFRTLSADLEEIFRTLTGGPE
jgi:ABC-2 type transport system ATP-binding protein